MCSLQQLHYVGSTVAMQLKTINSPQVLKLCRVKKTNLLQLNSNNKKEHVKMELVCSVKLSHVS